MDVRFFENSGEDIEGLYVHIINSDLTGGASEIRLIGELSDSDIIEICV